MQLSTGTLARASARHPWRTLVVWAVTFVAAGILSSALLGDTLTTESEFTNDPESQRAAALLEERLRGPGDDTEFVVVTGASEVTDPAYRGYVGELQAAVAALGPDVVTHVGSYLTDDGPVSETGRSTLLPVRLAGVDHAAVTDHAALVVDAVQDVEAPAGFEALVAGPATLENDTIELAEEGLQRGETIGLAVALVVLVIVFGAVVAGLIPIVLAVMAIAISLGAAAVVGQVFDLSFFITNIVTMIGLAVGIDYSLFIVSRYREERADGREKLDAIARAGATASKAVFVSGLTVVVALTGMLLLPDTSFRSIGVGAILVVLVSVAASLTLLPAILALLGSKVDALRIPGRRRITRRERGGAWDRITAAVMRRPVVSLVLSAGLLGLAALPFLGMATGFSGVSTLPDHVDSKRAFLVMEEQFSGGLGSPVEIVVDGDMTPRATAAIDGLRADLAADPSFGPSAVEVNDARDLTLVSAPLAGDVVAEDAIEAVRELRDVTIPRAFAGVGVDVLVGGMTATNVDILDAQGVWTPIVLLFVLGLSFVLLTVAFRSLVVPLKAIVMNLLSVGAAYGLLVLFFQRDTGPGFFKDVAGWLGFGQVEAIEAFLPLFLFTILFGLSMDYHVFLLSRIRERFERTRDNAGSVAYGLRTTGRLITGAAAIMVAVFGGFAAGDLVGLQQMGFGLAVAVALDATIVRSVLVPASMKLLGDRNWYLPSWLAWLPRLDLEGATREPALRPVGAEPERELVQVD
jgi:RND superfamily putative drug exporter